MTNKKVSILCILKILQEHSDESHPLLQSEIVKKLHNIYDLDCERKSVAYNIECLQDFGYDIITVKNKGVYLGERDFEPSEVTFLIDAVFSSRTLSSKKAKDLADKVSNFLSNHQKKKYNYVYKSSEVNRTDNEQIFYNIDIINEAIEKGKQISFNYNKLGVDGKMSQRGEGRTYIINPYFMVNSQGKYFLVCNYSHFNEIANYKLEYISNIKILDTPIRPVTELENYENGIDISKYINENIYMFGGKTITARFKVSGDYAINRIMEWFGDNAKITEQNGEYIATVTANENSLIYWSLQFSTNTELISPQETREKIKQEIINLNKKYL